MRKLMQLNMHVVPLVPVCVQVVVQWLCNGAVNGQIDFPGKT